MTKASTPRSAWDRDVLPQGDDKAAAVQQMFDSIGRLRLVNRIMTYSLIIHSYFSGDASGLVVEPLTPSRLSHPLLLTALYQ